jgi:hypothetical protein
MIKQIRIKKRRKTTNYTYFRRNYIDRKLIVYFYEYIKKYHFNDKGYPLILFFDRIYKDINRTLKNEHEKLITEKTLFKYIKRIIIKNNIYCIILKINKRTKKWEILFEYKPGELPSFSEDQLIKLDRELSKDLTNEKNEK